LILAMHGERVSVSGLPDCEFGILAAGLISRLVSA
jgi:hypothetical protein